MTDNAKVLIQKHWLPLLSTESIKALATAIKEKDPRLVKGKTTNHINVGLAHDWPADCATWGQMIG